MSKHRHFVFTWNNPRDPPLVTEDPENAPIGPAEQHQADHEGIMVGPVLQGMPGLSTLISWTQSLGLTYLVGGFELGESQTPHWQGSISFASPRTVSSVRKLLRGCHVEVQRGTHEEAHDYCRKDGKYYEWGVSCKDQSIVLVNKF